jgi:hypothetical protein
MLKVLPHLKKMEVKKHVSFCSTKNNEYLTNYLIDFVVFDKISN